MPFVRPIRPKPAPGPRPGPPASAPAAPAPPDQGPPQADLAGTVVLVASLIIAGCLLDGARASDVAHRAAVIVGAGVAGSALIDLRRGVRNLVRADLLALVAFYFLTFFEFLFPQDNFDSLVDANWAAQAVIICLWAFAGLAIGRHLSRGKAQPFSELLTRPLPSSRMIAIYLGCVVIGYLHMFVAEHFNILAVINDFMGPRFSQPWGRGKFGDWKALFVELGMLLFLIPPMAGIILAQRKNYSSSQLFLVIAALLFTLFYGFTSGTRHIFDSYLVTFLIGYAFASEDGQRKELITVASACAVLLLVSTVLMVRFRDIGLKSYLSGEHQESGETREESLSVDLNLYPMSRIAEVFPRQHDFLGWEIVYQALIRPIPRAIWTGKPEGMSLSIEDAVGAKGWTVAASFAGEAYMSGGLPIVFLCGLGFGWLAAWWNRLVSPRNSQFGFLIYASGFFAVVISMRSLLVFTTAMLPTLAAFAGGSLLIAKGVERVKRVLPGARRPRLHPGPGPVRARMR